jgi:hypothetical protein
LIDRLGLLEIEQKQERRQRRKSVEREGDATHRTDEILRRERRRSRPQAKSSLGLFCCTGDIDEHKRAPRPTNKPSSGRKTANVPADRRPKVSTNAHRKQDLQRPAIVRDPLSQTGELLTLIPPSTSPQTTALLLAELAKPVSTNDEEGFIYMFWLTPESLPSEAVSEAAPSLLTPPSQPKRGGRRTSDVLNSFATTTTSSTDNEKKTILLKIGRAANVQRRLNQWTRQCGYNLSLIRYYPYHSTTLSESTNVTPTTPRKVPNVHKVERLIHIELNAKRSQSEGKCESCGRDHREWFEVEAGREAVKTVDEVIRRWVDWSEKNAGN